MTNSFVDLQQSIGVSNFDPLLRKELPSRLVTQRYRRCYHVFLLYERRDTFGHRTFLSETRDQCVVQNIITDIKKISFVRTCNFLCFVTIFFNFFWISLPLYRVKVPNLVKYNNSTVMSGWIRCLSYVNDGFKVDGRK